MTRVFVCDIETDLFDETKDSDYILAPKFIIFKELGQIPLYIDLRKNLDDLRDLLSELCSTREKTIIYAHNLDFELKYLFECLPREYEQDVIRTGGKTIAVRLFRTRATRRRYCLELRDSFALFPSALAKIGHALGYEKGDTELSSQDLNEFVNYCIRDCEIVERAISFVCDFVRSQFDIKISPERLPLTFSSLSKRVWMKLEKRRVGELETMNYFNIPSFFNEEFRPFYFGGRVEVFNFNSLRDGYYYDYNSHYPAVMRDYEFPVPPYYWRYSSESIAELLDDELFVGARVIVDEQRNIPLAPVRANSGKILYPTGEKRCFLFREELEEIKDDVIKIEKVLRCSAWAPALEEFVTSVYSEREREKAEGRGEGFLAYLYKMLMNSLYGKFAENHTKDQFVFSFNQQSELDETMILPDGSCLFLNRGEKTFKLKTNLIWAMRVTALGRLRIWRDVCALQGHYCDTDSIVSDNQNVECSNKLGALKIEFQFDEFQALGCKEYAYYHEGVTSKMKGFSRQSYNSVGEFVATYFHPKKISRPSKIFESLARGIHFHTMLVFKKVKGRVYDSRLILPDFTTRPLSVEETYDLDSIRDKNERMLIKLVERYQNES